jgi:anti-sigma factor (TIGR02949 family)
MSPFDASLLSRWLRRLFQGSDHAAVPERGALAPAQGVANTAADVDAAQMPMLDCESVMRQLWDYLDGELTLERAAAIRAHIEMCQRCYPQHEFERSFLDAVAASAREHSNSERLRASLMDALRANGLRDA